MRVVALLAVRNEERYLARCLDHLCSQGIETCLIDNDSTDRTLAIADSFRDRGLFRIDRVPFNGVYEWQQILKHKEQLANEIEADWFIHQDADEIREAPAPYKTLLEGIKDADSQGYNAINFDEFVFLPISDDESYEGTDYVQTMRYYYFFQPRPLWRINAWKKTNASANIADLGGHQAKFEGRRIFPINFILRHYIVLSRSHAIAKYTRRNYSSYEVMHLGWHGRRPRVTVEGLAFPLKQRLKTLCSDGWDKSEPWVDHEFLGDARQV